ncbi:PTS sugar transporter subunit IIC [Candidatus Epulonipiscium fishelsonii]|uniref:PTS sugar transporter subunit IIC n=1 Tax=Candidatus Epulonipiscium fishelsonii TaxID=77094 RepID=A0ACC8XA68_9FIRM|nr:PTS sugar transporter subunit IIC [Epulopiscium sp. SCG-B11WGA-EpuloA1]
MKSNILEVSQKFSRAVIQPVLFMSIMGTILAIAVVLQLDFMPSFVNFIGSLLNTMMNAMLNNLSVIFCVGLSAAFARQKKVDAAITGVITYLFFLSANNAWLLSQELLMKPGEAGLYGTGQAMVLGYQVIDMNVFLGMFLGCLVGYVHNKYCNIEFKDIFRIYGGSRFAFIIMIPITLVLAIAMSYVWPVISGWITALTTSIQNSGSIGVFNYTAWNMWLIPTGLHHLLWMPFFYTPLGGELEIAGQMVYGAQSIFFAQMANVGAVTEIHDSVRFLFMGMVKIFGSLGVTMALIKTAKPENKAAIKGMLYPGLFVALMTGILEPLHFTYLFAAPILWLAYGLIGGITDAVLYILGAKSAIYSGIVDAVVLNSVFDISLTKIYIPIIVGIIMTAVMYFTFVFLINKLNLKTPGREEDIEIKADNTIKGTPSKFTDKDIEYIIEGMGGINNIISVGNCFTRLRCQVKDKSLINKELLNKVNSSGVVINNENVQIIIGMKVEGLKTRVCAAIGMDS